MTATSGRLATAGATVAVMLLVSRLLGWVRVAVLAATFGPGPELDAFYAAFRIPDLVFQLVAAGSLSSALLPVLGGLIAGNEQARAWRLASTIANLLLIAMTVLAAGFAIFAPQLVPLLAPGFDQAVQAETVVMTRIMVLSPILLGLGSVATAVLNVQGRFAASALAPILYNLGIIGGAVVLTPILGAQGLAVGVVLGALGGLLIQLAPLWRIGIRYRRILDFGDPLARRVLVLLAPRTLGQGASQITFLVVTTLASGLGTGAVTEFNFAFTLAQVPMALIGMPLGIVVFPTLVRFLASGAVDEYAALLTRSLRFLVFLVIPLTAIVIVLSSQLVTLVLGFGRLSEADIASVAVTLGALTVGLIGFAVNPVLTRAFYAAEDTRTPVLAAVGGVAISVVLAPLLVGPFGLPGIGAAMAIANTLESLGLLVVLARRGGAVKLAPLGTHLVRVLAVTAPATLGALAVLGWVAGLGTGGWSGAFIEAAATGLAFGGIFVGLAFVLLREQLESLVSLLPIRRGGQSGGTS